jgi:UDP-N-acetylglucosamine transferase subunit ALG13
MGRAKKILSKRRICRRLNVIFLTVGTHEQPFDRLIKEIDTLKGENKIKENVFMQIGYSNYKPKFCEYSKMLKYPDMNKYIRDSTIVITHGGPGSIMLPLSVNKIPIVVPRQYRYNEHVDNHQVLFTNRLEKEKKIIAVYEMESLLYTINNYNQLIKDRFIQKNSNLNSVIKRLNQITNNSIR